jgi:3-phenylpropionate/trans-cinnamate dioxygenase ferredoxin reductase component
MRGVRAGNRIIIVGTGPAGLAVARAYRKLGGAANLTMIGRERQPPYRRPPLTKEFLRGELDATELPLERAEWFEEQKIDLLLGNDVSQLNARAASITIDGEVLHGDAVVLATGAESLRPPLPGLDDPRVRTMREQSDSELISRQVDVGTRVAVLGAGFIGCEIAASLTIMGAEVTLIGRETAPQQGRLGADAASRIWGWLAELGVELWTEAEVAAVQSAHRVELSGGKTLDVDIVIAAMGVKPRSELARDAGLAIVNGRVGTDERMRAASRVFAVGDVACALNKAVGRGLPVEHWGDALAQGTVAGQVLAGDDAAVWDSVPGFWSTIGNNTLKYSAWGDGHDGVRFEEHEGGAFVVWYQRHGVPVGVLTHDRDEDYEIGRQMILDQAPSCW